MFDDYCSCVYLFLFSYIFSLGLMAKYQGGSNFRLEYYSSGGIILLVKSIHLHRKNEAIMVGGTMSYRKFALRLAPKGVPRGHFVLPRFGAKG